jgi:high-affinity iron transporter
VALCAAALVALSGAAASARDQPAPWRAGERVSDLLFDAQEALLLSQSGAASRSATAAERVVAGRFRAGLRRDAPAQLRAIDAALSDAAAAAASGDEVGLAAARGRARAAIFAASYRAALAAIRRGDAKGARGWLLLREFRQSTRFTRPGVDATVAVRALAGGKATPEATLDAVRKDLLDAYQAQMRVNLDAARTAAERGFDPRWAETAATAAGYWRILAPTYRQQRGDSQAETANHVFGRLAASAASGKHRGFDSARRRVADLTHGFTAAEFTAAEQARRAQQLLRFVELIPIEYDHGVDGTRVTVPFELQEALAFHKAGVAALADLEAELERRDAAALNVAEDELRKLGAYSSEAADGRRVATVETVKESASRATDALEGAYPQQWKESSVDTDFDLIDISLDRMESEIGAGRFDQAEQARLETYAFIEFGPEFRLRAFDPQLATEIEGLVWFGARGEQGLAQLISGHASVRDVRETRVALDEALGQARATLGEDASGISVITNAALVVFREGLEAVLIIAAITASFAGAMRPLRRPVLIGAALALPASFGLWVAAQTILSSLSRYGEKLEAITGLVAIAVLLIVLNWFFHRVYWTGWISRHRKRGQKILAAAATGGALTAQLVGLYLLGFTSVFREGFETVLFLQALELGTGPWVVAAGVSLGLIATAAVGALTFVFERRLPYRRMLIVTGVLIALVLVTVVGNTVRSMQGVGWIGVTPIDLEMPLWLGTWFGVFPSVQTLAAQAAAIAFVIGSYFLAERMRKRGAGPRGPSSPERTSRPRTSSPGTTGDRRPSSDAPSPPRPARPRTPSSVR